jgi:signal transduction histidine kinase
VVSYRSIHEFETSAAIVTRSQAILTSLGQVESDIVTAESEARGYVITGDERYLKLYQTALEEVESDLSQLHNLVMSPDIRKLNTELERLLRERIDRLKRTVAIRKLEGIEAVVVVAGPGKKVMDEVRRVITTIEAEEERLLRERDLHARELAGRTTLVILLGSMLAILLAAFSTMIIIADLAHRERLEREVLEISEREQRRIGQDLHDGVCQHLTGISLLCRSLQQKLNDRAAPETKESARITSLVNEGIEQTRRVTHGLYPVANEPGGLMLALQALATSVHETNQLACVFECPASVVIPDQMVATHLYRLAQEAVQNAIRHAQPTAITLRLTANAQAIHLTVQDDGCGMPTERSRKHGLGLDIMNYRASTIGARLDLLPGNPRGTLIRCVLPRAELG